MSGGISHRSGGVNLSSNQTDIGGDVTGRDKIITQHITPTLHATPPRPPDHFTGREADLEKFSRLLTTGQNAAITALHGMGGIGKTALALKLAEQIAAQFPGGVLWWGLGPEPNVITALDVWARHADPRADLTALPTAEARAEAVRPMLARLGKLCVMLDDVWDAQSARVLRAALPSDSVVLITTRNAQVAGALGYHVERIERLTPAECLELLSKLYAPQSLSPYHSAAQDIVAIIDGLPLALKLIRGLADTPARLPRVVEKLRRKPLLDILKLPEDEGREASLEWCLALSYAERLDADMQRRFRALGAFARAPYNRAAISAVWDDADAEAVTDAIEYLVQRNLLEEDEAAQEYSQHALLRAYAVALLDKENEHHTAAARHADYYRTFAKTQDWRATEHAFDQIEHGWQWVQTHAREQIIDYVLAVRVFFNLRGRLFEHMEWQNTALTQAHAANDRKNEGMLLNNIGDVHDNFGQRDEALDFYGQALATLQEVGNHSGIVALNYNIGQVYHRYGQWQEALYHFQQALATFREMDNRSMKGMTLYNIGKVYDDLGQKNKAPDFYQQVLAIDREVGVRWDESIILFNIGKVYDDLGQKDKALDFYQQALAIDWDESIILFNIGKVYDDLDQKDKALDFYKLALAIDRKVDDRWDESSTLSNIGVLLDKMGRTTEAVTYLEQCVALDEAIGHPNLESDRVVLEKVRGKLGKG